MEINSVTFFGYSSAQPHDKIFQDAKNVAIEVAKSGRTIINGGGPGIMLASTLGAKQVNGKTTVVYYQPELASNFEGKNVTNIADKSYEEANYILRTKKLLELGDAYIVFNGGTGTISEFAMAWGVARLYIDHHKPILLYGDFWDELMESFKKYMLIRHEEQSVYNIVNSPEEVMRSLERFEEVLKINRHYHKECKGPECSLLL